MSELGDPICFLPTFENNSWNLPKAKQSTSYDIVQAPANTQYGPGFGNDQFQRRHVVSIPPIPDEKELQRTQQSSPLWDLRSILTFIRPNLHLAPGAIYQVPTEKVLWACLDTPPAEIVNYQASPATYVETLKFELPGHCLPSNAHKFFKSWKDCSVLERVYYLRAIQQAGKVTDIWSFQYVVETLLRADNPQELKFADRLWQFQKAHAHEWRVNLFIGGLVRRAMAESSNPWPKCAWEVLQFVHEKQAWADLFEVPVEMKRFQDDLNSTNRTELMKRFPTCFQVQFAPNCLRKGIFRQFGRRATAETVEMYFHNRTKPALIQVAHIRDPHMLAQLPS